MYWNRARNETISQFRHCTHCFSLRNFGCMKVMNFWVTLAPVCPFVWNTYKSLLCMHEKCDSSESVGIKSFLHFDCSPFSFRFVNNTELRTRDKHWGWHESDWNIQREFVVDSTTLRLNVSAGLIYGSNLYAFHKWAQQHHSVRPTATTTVHTPMRMTTSRRFAGECDASLRWRRLCAIKTIDAARASNRLHRKLCVHAMLWYKMHILYTALKAGIVPNSKE